MMRGYVLIGSEEVLAADLLAPDPASSTLLNTEIDLASPISLKEITKSATQDLEQQIILKVLEANSWSRRKTAQWLNISYRSLLYKLQESQIRGFLEMPSKAKDSASTSIPPQTATSWKKVKPQRSRKKSN
jgi:two-component system response regulator AtoC